MSPRGWALFAAVSVVWGVPYLFIKLAVEDLSPGFVAWSRVALGALVLLPIAWRTGALRGLPLRWLTAFALFEITIPFPLIAFGEQRVSSSLAAILIAAVPLVVAFLALRFDRAEQPTRTRFIGMLIGLGGVAALVGIDIGGRGSELLGAAAVLAATFGYACGPLIVKRHLSGADPLGPVAGALGIAAIMLLPLALGGLPTETPPDEAIASVVVLGLICTALAFLIFFRLIAEIGPSRATIITYVNPVVALALGVAILDEHVTTGTVAGLLLILAGSWLSTDGRLPPGLAAVVTRRLRGVALFARAGCVPLLPPFARRAAAQQMRHAQHAARGRPQRLAQLRSDALGRQLQLDLDAAVGALLRPDRADLLDQLQHGAVLGQDLGAEAADALGPGALGQTVQQRRRHALALPRVGNRDRHFGDLAVLGRADEARHADAALGPGLDRHQSLVVVVVDLGEVGQLGLAQVAGRREEAPVARLRAEAPHPGRQLGPVVRPDRPHDDLAAVAQALSPHRAGSSPRPRP